MDNGGLNKILGRVFDEASQELNRARTELQKTVQLNHALVQELRSSRLSMVQALVQAMDVRDVPTNGHCQRVVRYSLATASKLGLEDSRLEGLHYGVLLHDIGKIGVPDAILNKPGPLTEEEWAQMKRHPEFGHQLLQGLDFLKDALPVVLCHHERFDGRGYPGGLGGGEIPLSARIFSVADSFDAMTTNRPYRQAITSQAAVEEIKLCSGTQFDRDVVNAFLRTYDEGFLQWAGNPEAAEVKRPSLAFSPVTVTAA